MHLEEEHSRGWEAPRQGCCVSQERHLALRWLGPSTQGSAEAGDFEKCSLNILAIVKVVPPWVFLQEGATTVFVIPFPVNIYSFCGMWLPNLPVWILIEENKGHEAQLVLRLPKRWSVGWLPSKVEICLRPRASTSPTSTSFHMFVVLKTTPTKESALV